MVPKTVYLFCFLFCFKIVLNCECPFKAPEPPVEVPLFNDYKPEKVVINDIDYGYPFHIGGVIVLQHPVASGVQVFPHKCPAPYRPPVKEELEAIFADLVADNYSFIFSEEGFNLTTNNVILTSTKPVQEYWRWYGTKLDSTKPYEVVDLMTYWMGERLVTLCVKPDTQTQDIVIDTLGVNKNHPTTFKVDENNIKGALWKVNFEIFKTKELTQKYTDNECRLIEVWYITPGDKVLYACRAVQVGNLPYVNVPTTFSPDKITTIETGLEILVQPSIVVTPSNGPIGPKFNGGFYLFYSLKSDNHLHVREYDNEFKQVVDYDLEIDNKKISVKKNILVLDKKNLTEIINAIISDLNVDKKSLEIINKYISIDQLGLDIINNLDENIVFYFNTYSSDSKLLKYEIEINNISSTFGTNINNFVISFFQNEIIEFYADNNLIASINYYSDTDNDLVDIYVFENKLLSIKFNNLENEKLASVKFYNGFGSNFILDLSFAIDKDIENNYSKLDNQLLLDFNMFGLNLFKFKILDYINFYMNNTGIDFNSKDLEENLDITSIDFNKVKQVFCDFIKIEEN